MTLSQLTLLFEHSMKRKEEDMRFSAVLHGADPATLDQGKSATATENSLLFGDPAAYEKMSDSEKKEVSEKMRSKFGAMIGSVRTTIGVSKNV